MPTLITRATTMTKKAKIKKRRKKKITATTKKKIMMMTLGMKIRIMNTCKLAVRMSERRKSSPMQR